MKQLVDELNDKNTKLVEQLEEYAVHEYTQAAAGVQEMKQSKEEMYHCEANVLAIMPLSTSFLSNVNEKTELQEVDTHVTPINDIGQTTCDVDLMAGINQNTGTNALQNSLVRNIKKKNRKEHKLLEYEYPLVLGRQMKPSDSGVVNGGECASKQQMEDEIIEVDNIADPDRTFSRFDLTNRLLIWKLLSTQEKDKLKEAYEKGGDSNGAAIQHIEEAPKKCNSMSSPNPTSISAKNQNKKRSYVQLHLDLGQSDFLLCTCSICGFKFVCGDEGDEKVHKEFHKDCSHGIQFKGWYNERVVHLPSTKLGRIILVLDGDPPAHKKKVQKVVQMMEMDLGSGWLIHKLCKVYLYIFHQRIAGCLVAESIKTAYRVLSNLRAPKSVNDTNTNNNGSNSSILEFGGINFQREAVKRAPSAINPEASEEDLMRAIFLGNEAVPAICGIRAIWVAPSMRRKQIACQLLDAVRMSFCKGSTLKPSQLAFSNPTATGRALACRYFGTSSFLAYKAAD